MAILVCVLSAGLIVLIAGYAQVVERCKDLQERLDRLERELGVGDLTDSRRAGGLRSTTTDSINW